MPLAYHPTKHTPGPWCIDEDGELTARDEAVVLGHLYSIEDFPCFDPEDDETKAIEVEQEYTANRALVRIAPDMYDILAHFIWRFTEDNRSLRPFLGDDAYERVLAHFEGTVKEASAILAKARGEEEDDELS